MEFVAVGHPFEINFSCFFLCNVIVNLPLICPLKIHIKWLCSLGCSFLDIFNVDLFDHSVNYL